MESLKIIFVAILASVIYGIIHDQITARICVEYFTIGHPDVFGTDDPTLLGLGWGVIATWWVGAGLGVILVIASRVGQRPKRTARDLIRPIAILMIVCGLTAACAGLLGYFFAQAGWVNLVGQMAKRVPVESHNRFIVDLWAHSASYLSGTIGGLLLAFRIWKSRGRSELPTASEEFTSD
ncbi:hypothetical protein KOR42_00480 [Thalassoglobus neptunius]|uniref:Uncharacterized protein n=1 Tax=Thalassoglobus neptunius TaxID=1938619 RepID=A0A5C5X0M4_9PLAN|nr:hypothetical protein [Thalassoglobus neptunius]TWT56694.1 hypothetical protein KOR42_00480 [Thalassoglobus neptunius]